MKKNWGWDFEKYQVGGLQTNCYILWNRQKQSVVIDPGDDGVEIAQRIGEKDLKLTAIWLTHGHFDHTLGVLDLEIIFKPKIYLNNKDQFLFNRQDDTARYFGQKLSARPKIDTRIVDLGQIKNVYLGETGFEVWPTPGHTPGGVCFYQREAGVLFSGDILLNGEVGRTNFSYSSKTNFKNSLEGLLGLADEVLVLPGHGEKTTIGEQRRKIQT